MADFNVFQEDDTDRIKERLRQERETFDQHKEHENRWFHLRLVMGYSAAVLLIALMVVSSYILFNNTYFSNGVVTLAGAALFVDALGVVITIHLNERLK
jgi:cytochrome b subunit of formate dehydrogenase